MLSPIAIHSKHKGIISSEDGVVRSNPYFGDLGKATLRGVRKCEKCGTLNGTRGIRCKNPACDQVFKASEKKKPIGPEASKLVTDPSIQVYSVRSRTGDARGFVQLPIVQDLDGNPAVVDIGIVCSAAKCYVETCARSRNETLDPCFHIQSSVEALEEAIPLTFKNSILNSMAITVEMRQQIWSLATDKPGPLVQRITKNIMAVKTAVTVKHQLGYLHFSFHPNKRDEKRFVCSCKDAKITRVTMSESDTSGECTYRIQRCIHFYACVCSFASDEALSKEFQYVIDADADSERTLGTDGNSMAAENSAAIESVNTIETEELIEVEYAELNETDGDNGQPLEVITTSTNQHVEYNVQTSSRKHTLSLPSASVSQPDSKRYKSTAVLIKPQTSNLNSGQTSQSFIQWLQTVTERINLTMHYSLPGNPKPLVFHIPQAFWDCMMTRLSNCSTTKRLLPNQTCTVIRTQIPPLGTYTQFSWYLTELAHVRKVFDTAEVALLVSKYYDRASDGSYTLSVTPRVQVDTGNSILEPSTPPSMHHNSHEYKTFLRVGQQGNQGVAPFIIDWMPDVFPLTHSGELSISFQYSHMIDGLSPAVEDDMVQQVIEGTSKHNHNIIITSV